MEVLKMIKEGGEVRQWERNSKLPCPRCSYAGYWCHTVYTQESGQIHITRTGNSIITQTGVIVSVSLKQTSSTACIFPSLFSIWAKKDDIFNHFSDVYVLYVRLVIWGANS